MTKALTPTPANLFEIASRLKFRYSSAAGDLNAEQLWELKLSSDRSADVTLDTVARETSAKLRAVTEESFVETKPNRLKETLNLKLDLVKYVIAVKLGEAEERKNAAARQEEIKLLTGLLAEKENEALKGLSREEIAARIEALNVPAS